MTGTKHHRRLVNLRGLYSGSNIEGRTEYLDLGFVVVFHGTFQKIPE
jgi:hypothetical protein